jgi:hypothetical protein
VKLELGVLALNDEITTFQAKKRCPDNTITLTPGILISIYLVCKCLWETDIIKNLVDCFFFKSKKKFKLRIWCNIFVDISVRILQNFNVFFQNVLLEHMVSTVNIDVTHVSTSCVAERTESVHMVVLTALMEIVVNFQVFWSPPTNNYAHTHTISW